MLKLISANVWRHSGDSLWIPTPPPPPQSISTLVQVSEGDLRKAITFLQSAARLSPDKEITDQVIIEIAGVSGTRLTLYLSVEEETDGYFHKT